MNPELPAPQITPESQPPQRQEADTVSTPETIGEQTHEREQGLQKTDRQNGPMPTVPLPPPTVVSLPAVPTPSTQDDSAGPTLANDDDLIEKEWVDKAKQIITETQNDPYRREQEVNKLQVDYLRKRYGKELGTSN